jgi:D-alanyl-D-alanine carboxypeptidase
MKNNIVSYLCIALLFSHCSNYIPDMATATCIPAQEEKNAIHAKVDSIQQAIQQLVNEGVSGVALAVYSGEGWWTTSAGFARIEDKTPMQPCHLQYLQSISKTYMAVAILKLYEQGKIDLEAPITRYLPEKYSRYITDAEKITVHMLLNHTSGIAEYNAIPAYFTRLIQHPDYAFTALEYLQYIDGKALSFAPGSQYSYRNTNYVILALIADALTGDHAAFISTTIFKTLGLTETFYRSEPGYLNYPNVVNAYWDRYSDGIVENASVLQRNNVVALIGDDGIVATPADAVKFLRGLMEGKLLSAATLELMKSWAKDRKGNPTYGLGLDYATFNKQIAYGHSGGGIGAGCQLYYFPKKNCYIFVGINLGTVTDSPLHAAVKKATDKLYKALLE